MSDGHQVGQTITTLLQAFALCFDHERGFVMGQLRLLRRLLLRLLRLAGIIVSRSPSCPIALRICGGDAAIRSRGGHARRGTAGQTHRA